MDWSKGYSASYYMTVVDPHTWRDIERVELTGGSIKRTASGLMESASVDCVNYSVGIEQWIRVYMDTRQGGSAAHTALFTGLATSPEDEIDGVVVGNTLDCYSVLKPADDIVLQRGWYAPAGINGAEAVRRLLAVTPAPIEIDGIAPGLSNSIIAEDDETNLTMVEKILTAINWRLRIRGDGTIVVAPAPSEPAVTLDPNSYDVLETEIKIKADWYGCPNVFMAVNDDMTAIARDDSPASMLSTVNRGREVWMRESNCDLAANESIAEYAARRLKEEQRVQREASYDRRYIPDLLPGDLVRIRYPGQRLDGVFAVDSQSVELGYGARTAETVTAEA